MAHSLSITDGTTTIALSQVNGYQITNEAVGTDENAGARTDIHNPEIDSSFDMLVLAAAGSMQTLARNVERLLVRAKRRQAKPEGPRVYLLLQVHGEVSPWRAEIVDGRFKPVNPLVNWFSNAVPFRLLVTHRAWEGPRTELAIGTFSDVSASTGGKAILQKNNDIFLVIAADQISGSLPAYAEVQITNTSGSEVDFRNWYMAVNAYANGGGAQFLPMFEGEDRTSGGTPTPNGGCSGGDYNAFSFTNIGYIDWDIGSHMSKTRGRSLKILVRLFAASGTNLQVQPQIVESLAQTPIEYGRTTDLPNPTSRLIDLDSLTFPPGNYNPSASGGIFRLALTAAGAGVFHLDYFQLMPLDSFQHIYQHQHSIANGASVVFDNIEELYYTGAQSIFTVQQGRLMLFPGILQRLYILADEGGYSDVSRTFSVRIYVRERRLTV